MSLKILWITSDFPSHPKSSRHLYLWHSLEALKQENVTPTVLYTPAWKPFFKEGVDAMQFSIEIKISRYLSIPRHYLRIISNYSYLLNIVPQIKKLNEHHKFDIIHAHGEIAGLAAIEAAKQLNIPAVVTIHGIDMCPRMSKGYTKKMFCNVLTQAAKVIYVGEPLLKHFFAMTQCDTHCRILHNGFRLPSVQQSKRMGYFTD